MAYFDNAATTYPKPDEVYSYMTEFYKNNGASVGRGDYSAAKSAGELVAETRMMVQSLLHCPSKQVIFTPTATIAINVILQGLVQMGCKEIYVSPFEHNAVTRTLHAFECAGTIRVHQLYVAKDFDYDLERIRYQFEENPPDLVVASHASNVCGLIAPVVDIFKLAKEFKATTVLDMAQTAGLVDIDIGLNVFDFAVFAGHKTLYGPTGISGFVMNPSILLPPILYGGTGYESANQDMPTSLPERFEMGTLNISGIAGLHASLRWIISTSVDCIRKKELENREKLIDLLGQYRFMKIVGNYPNRDYVGIVSCLIDGLSSDSAGKVFSEAGVAVRTGLHCAPLAHKFMNTFPAGTVRFSVGYFTSEEDFSELRNVLNQLDDNL